MALLFSDLQNEVKRRATRDQGGTAFDDGVKNIINTSIFRIGREACWRSMRRKATFDTSGTYTTGSGSDTFTNGSKNVTIGGATLITDGIRIGRRIKLSGDSQIFTIRTITGETTLTIDQNYGGTTTSSGTYSILGQEEYNLPIQTSHRVFLWHEDFGHPYLLTYLTDREFYDLGIDNTIEDTPTHYRMWGEDMVDEQLLAASTITISSSSSSDTSIDVTIFGVVSGYPDYETITTNASNGTTAVAGNKSFTSVERVVKAASSVGRITVTANSTNTNVAVLPVGDTTSGIVYRKIQLYPLPSTVFTMNVQYYKDPYRLVNSGDVHELGQDFDEAIILLATAKLKAESNQKESGVFYNLYQDEIRNLKKNNMDKIDWFPTLKRPGTRGRMGLHPQLSFQQIGSHYGWSQRL